MAQVLIDSDLFSELLAQKDPIVAAIAANYFKEFGNYTISAMTFFERVVPSDHPLRRIRVDFDAAYSGVASAFQTSYGSTGNVSIPTAVLLRAWLLMALYSLRSERALCEQITMNAGFRWFVGLDWDDKVFDHSTLSRNRERLFGSGAAEALLGEVVRIAQSKRLLASDRLVVVGRRLSDCREPKVPPLKFALAKVSPFGKHDRALSWVSTV